MAITAQNGRVLATITVDGEEMRPRDARFVIFNPVGLPVGEIPSDSVLMDNIARAARSYWKNETTAIYKLNDGYRIELMSNLRFYTEHAARMQPETN